MNGLFLLSKITHLDGLHINAVSHRGSNLEHPISSNVKILLKENNPATLTKFVNFKQNVKCFYQKTARIVKLNSLTIDVLMSSSTTFARLNRPQSQSRCISNRKLLRIQFHKVLFSPSTLLLLFSRSLLFFDPLKLFTEKQLAQPTNFRD